MLHNHNASGDPLASCPRNLAYEGDVPPPSKKKCTKETDEEGNIRLPQDICVPSMREAADIEKLLDHDDYIEVFPTQLEML
jgi:hypothetical protein